MAQAERRRDAGDAVQRRSRSAPRCFAWSSRAARPSSSWPIPGVTLASIVTSSVSTTPKSNRDHDPDPSPAAAVEAGRDGESPESPRGAGELLALHEYPVRQRASAGGDRQRSVSTPGLASLCRRLMRRSVMSTCRSLIAGAVPHSHRAIRMGGPTSRMSPRAEDVGASVVPPRARY